MSGHVKKVVANSTIEKSALIKTLKITKDDLKKINSYTMKDLTAEDVFTFKLAMENNCVDRQYESMSDDSLTALSNAFIGRPLIKNHDWTDVDNEVARIYDTQIDESDSELNEQGNPVKTLVAKLYMVRTDSNKDLISEIQAGIKKECSVGFSCKSLVCSICGVDNMNDGICKHFPGRVYDGKTCTFMIDNIEDAYEVSLVTVPAVKTAGVTKSLEAMKKDIADDPESEGEEQQPVEKQAEEPNGKSDDISLAVEIAQARVDLLNESAFCSESKEEKN
ncbi:MAG: hypothetical protein LKF53_02730 [Solobacterium sp.]|jgi:hypothetical protein|nr:hypothetical protein [Solobacterium sp.]MCH4205294.1 hypothetical protein [Solobacterium sp.]MCH4226887.1 hypothetical protein [Solobacterium sp.]MCH4281647.1 hypothetical protein [Solobacterium sp.]